MRSLVILLLGLAACARNDGSGRGAGDSLALEPPVLTNPETPVRYPPELYARRVEGTVVLRLFVDEAGRVVADSARVVEPSGHDALDSAALAAVPDMRFSPARKDGAPVATAFLQPVHFRHPENGSGGGS